MPTVKNINNIKIDFYSRDHPQPLFHAKFAEFEELMFKNLGSSLKR
jgi:hypothetical protein